MQDASLQYGWRLRPDIALRAYAMGAWHDSDVTATGANAKDLWSKGQAGFRMDWSPGAEQMTLQGDLYRGAEKEAIAERQIVGGGNLVARWTHSFSGGSSLQVQTYYDELSRRVTSVANDRVRTYDLDVQHSFAWGSRQAVVWGAGLRVSQDRFTVVPGNPTSPLTQFFDPESRTLILGDVFAQDTITLTPTLQATVGLKLEDDPYSGMATLPSLRLSWKPTGTMLLWAAASRAIRAPSRLDRDFFETQGATVVLKGGDFQAETLVAYELGYRGEPSDRLSVSVSAFYNVYDDLRTFEYAPGPSLPATIQNMLEGETYGVEVWGGYRVTNWWRLTAGANWLHEDLRFKPGSFKLGGVAIAGNDPTYQALLRSIMNLGPAVSLDLDLRQIGALKSPASPAYAELGGRLAWTVTPAVELALVGANLLHDHHPEFGGTGSAVQLGSSGVESGRSLALGARLRF
jgi:iron complex outermembrane receptor protein